MKNKYIQLGIIFLIPFLYVIGLVLLYIACVLSVMAVQYLTVGL